MINRLKESIETDLPAWAVRAILVLLMMLTSLSAYLAKQTLEELQSTLKQLSTQSTQTASDMRYNNYRLDSIEARLGALERASK